MNRLILLLVLMTTPAYADHNVSRSLDTGVRVVFEFPHDVTKQTTLTRDRGYEILKRKPLQKGVWVDDYKIDWWVFAALQDLDLPFETRTVGRTGGPWKTTILRIGDYTSGPAGRWTFYVNGIRSPYHISTQLEEGVKEIRFVFEPKRTVPNDSQETRPVAPEREPGA